MARRSPVVVGLLRVLLGIPRRGALVVVASSLVLLGIRRSWVPLRLKRWEVALALRLLLVVRRRRRVLVVLRWRRWRLLTAWGRIAVHGAMRRAGIARVGRIATAGWGPRRRCAVGRAGVVDRREGHGGSHTCS